MSVLPQHDGSLFLTDGGIETDLIFRRGVELPEFASFVLHDDASGEALLREYFLDYLRVAADAGVGLCWRRPRGAPAVIGG